MFARIRTSLFLALSTAVLASCTDINPEVSCLGSCNEAKTFEYSQQDGSLNFKGIFVQKSEVHLFEDDIEIPVQPTFGDNTLKIVPVANAPHQLKPSSIYKLMVSNAVANGTSTFTLPSSTSSGTLSGDVSGDTSTTSVDKIKGTPVSATAPTSGSFLKYDGTSWAGSAITTSDVGGLAMTLSGINTSLSNKLNLSQMPTSCGAGSTLTFSSPSGSFICSSIAISDAQISYGSRAPNTFLAGPTSSSGAPTFRTLTMADMPAGVGTSQWTTSGFDIYFSLGKVGIGTTSPGAALDVNGQIRITGGAPSTGKVLTSDSTGLATWQNSPPVTSSTITDGTITSADLATSISSALWSTTGSDVYRASGNVGIGKSNPTAPLDVLGNVTVNGKIYSTLVSSTFSSDVIVGYENGSNLGLVISSHGTGNASAGRSVIYGNYRSGSALTGGYIDFNTPGNNLRLLPPGNTSGHISIMAGGEIERVRISPNGYVGIGTSAPGYPLEVTGVVYATGMMYAQNFLTNSDVRYKRDIASLNNVLQKIMHLNGVTYNWRIDEFPEKRFEDRTQIGLIAQEVEKQFPEAVYTDDRGYKTVSYATLIAPVIEAIKELAGSKADKAEIEKLKSENAELKARLDRIEKTLLKK